MDKTYAMFDGVLSCPVLSSYVLSSPVLFCPVLSCPVLSCYCPVFSNLLLPPRGPSLPLHPVWVNQKYNIQLIPLTLSNHGQAVRKTNGLLQSVTTNESRGTHRKQWQPTERIIWHEHNQQPTKA